MKKKVLLIRLDKIGDLVCTLPTDQILDSTVYDITWVVQKGMGQIVDLGEKKRNYLELDKNTPEESKIIFKKFISQNKFDYAVSFQAPWWINFILYAKKIPKRIGVLSQWHSFLFLNQGLRQKRSLAQKHEFEYNLDLVQKITGPLQTPIENIYFKIKKPHTSEILEKYNLHNGTYTIIHPGMMGSALNCPQEKYIDYIQSEILKNKKIVITGTEADTPYLLKIKFAFEKNPNVIWLQSLLSLTELIQIIYYSEMVIAPSTGVAHLAASLGKKIIGLYSPVRVHHPLRWKPRGPQVFIALPDVVCPATHHCLKEKCPHFNCMNTIEIKPAL